MSTRIKFQDHTGSNSKIQGAALILKTLWEQVRMRKKSKQMFQGHVTDIMSILISFLGFF